MDNVVPFPDRRGIREEAGSWLISLEEGLTAEERARFDAWLRDPGHRDALIEQARLWDDLNVLSELSGIYPLDSYRAPRTVRLLKPLCLAAGIVGIVLVGAMLLSAEGENQGMPIAGTGIRDTVVKGYETAVGEQLTTRLPDGSVLSINTDSKLEVHYTAGERLILLQRGEALFDVAHDAARPFRVDAGRRILEALGTVFNVQRVEGGEIELTVVEGRVLVRRPESVVTQGTMAARAQAIMGPPLTVEAGQVAAIDTTVQRVETLAARDVDARMSWQRGALVFRGEPLERALAEVERYTNVRFHLKDSALATVQVGGYFRTGDVEGVVLALRESFGIEARWVSETEIELRAR